MSPTPMSPEIRYETIPEDRVEGKPLGRHLVHDERSRGFAAVEVVEQMAAAGGLEPRQKAWYRRSVFDQGSESSCTVQACAGVLVTHPYTKHLTAAAKKQIMLPAWRYQSYRRAQQLDPWPGEEPTYYGSSGLAACKAMVEAGVVPEGWRYRWAFGGDEAMRVLRFAALSVGTYWYSGFDRPDEHGRVRKTGSLRGGHQWEVIDYYEPDDLIVGLNSWGRGYAKNGRFAMPRTDFFDLLEEDGDVVVWSPA